MFRFSQSHWVLSLVLISSSLKASVFCKYPQHQKKRWSTKLDKTLTLTLSLMFPVRYYITKGAIVDQLGGDLNSTPLHWAIR